VALSGIVNSMKELRDITVQIFLLFNLVAMDDSREEFDLVALAKLSIENEEV
jgi:hypothetical protein